MNKRIRVLRVLEYTYDTVESMEHDMERWQIPANGSKTPGSRQVIKSATFPLEVIFVDLAEVLKDSIKDYQLPVGVVKDLDPDSINP